MKLVLMTKPTFFVEEDKILTALYDEGLDNLHLYKPGAAPMYSERLLTLLPEDQHETITVHEHFYLKEEYHLGGIHIDDMATPIPEGYKGHVSCTCTLDNDIAEAKHNFNYIILRDTFSTGGSSNRNDMERLEEASRRGIIDRRVYAMGGITVDNIQQAKRLGFGGVVVDDDLWNKFDIHKQNDYTDLLNHFDQLRKAAL